jgi:hypothetical protein
VLGEEKLDDIGARHEHTPRKSLKCLAQETEVSKSGVRRAIQLLKLRLYKANICHEANFCVIYLSIIILVLPCYRNIYSISRFAYCVKMTHESK